jgi:excisionase family DNA binding protein
MVLPESERTPVLPKGRTFNVKAACSYTGLSKSGLYAAMSRDTLRFWKIGGRTLIAQSDLEEWLKQETQQGKMVGKKGMPRQNR